MPVRVAARIQHHPARKELLPALLEALAPLSTEVIEDVLDPPPNPWRNYQRCLRSIVDAPTEVTHLLVVQDDVQLCLDFASVCVKIATAQPETPVCLFLGGFPQGTAAQARRAWLQNRRYVTLHRSPVVPVVAVLWPRNKAEEFLAWSQSGVTLIGHPTPRADDGICAQWMKKTGQQFLCSVPSIVQHADMHPSVRGDDPVGWGKDSLRVAALYEQDASKYDWS